LNTNQALRITHLATTMADGAGIAARRIHEALNRAGCDTRMLARDNQVGSVATAFTGTPMPGRRERLSRHLPWLGNFAQRMEYRIRRELAEAARHGSWELFSPPFSRCRPERHEWVRTADVVHLHWVAGFIDYPRFFATQRRPLVWTLHDQNPGLGGFHYASDLGANPRLSTLEWDCAAVKRQALAGHALVVVGNSAWTTVAASKSAGFPAGTRFETIYYPLDCEVFSPIAKPAARTALGLTPDGLVVGFASASLTNTRKGLGDLIAALGLLVENRLDAPPITLLSFGREPDQKMVQGLRLPWVHLGHLDSDTIKRAAYSAMDCFVVPSRAEAFGQTAIEAMACGTAVIGTDVGGLREALDHGRAGRLVPAGDIPAIAAAIHQLADDPDTRAAFADLGRKHVMARHDPLLCARQYQKLYHELKQPARG
jgi:glycosyltransferase involved in cell wall biosynthesis